MKAKTFFGLSVWCAVMVLFGCVSPVHAAANLVVTSATGPAQALLNETVAVACQVKNTGNTASGAYEVSFYLSQDKTIDPAEDRLLKKVPITKSLAAGKTAKTTTKVAIPNPYYGGLSGSYYYGAVVGASAKASTKQVAINRYKDNGDGTISDYKTGAMWQKTDDGEARAWPDAVTHCNDLELAGYDDWVLPSVDDFVTIEDYSRVDPSINALFDCGPDYYWSATPSARNAEGAWVVYFGDGDVFLYDKTEGFYARCVRAGS